MQSVGFGRFESVQIQHGELVLNPYPLCVRDIKFGVDSPCAFPLAAEFELKNQVAEFLAHVRAIDMGEIRCLTVRHGLPFAMELVSPPGSGSDTDA